MILRTRVLAGPDPGGCNTGSKQSAGQARHSGCRCDNGCVLPCLLQPQPEEVFADVPNDGQLLQKRNEV